MLPCCCDCRESHHVFCSTEASVNDRLMEHLKEFALWVKHLGTYSSGSVPTNVVESPRWKSLCNLASC